MQELVLVVELVPVLVQGLELELDIQVVEQVLLVDEQLVFSLELVLLRRLSCSLHSKLFVLSHLHQA